MQTMILKVVRQGEAFSVQSSKQESGQIQKCMQPPYGSLLTNIRDRCFRKSWQRT